MGYRARFSGEITVTPPLSWEIIKYPTRVRRGLQDLRIRLHEEVTDTAEGQYKVITGIAVAPAVAGEAYAGYDMVDELQALVDAYGKSHQFSGHIEAIGDEGDQWRLMVRDGKAVQVYPRVVWPDEEGT